MIWLDLETRSQVPLFDKGLMHYAQDDSTEVICISYALDDEPVQTWFAEDGEPLPADLRDAIASGVPIYAHNASFERRLFAYVICNDFDLPAIPDSQWRCSMARAALNGLPQALGELTRCVGVPVPKMKEGRRLIRDYCAPNFFTEWKEGDKALMQDYCEVDVSSMRDACRVMRDFTDVELAEWQLNERLNDYGIPVDVAFAKEALEYALEVKATADKKIYAVTEGAVKNARVRNAKFDWLKPRLTDEQWSVLEIADPDKGEDAVKLSLDAEIRDELLLFDDLNDDVRSYLEYMAEAGGSALSKYTVMVGHAIDNRVHDNIVWHSANTGRFCVTGDTLIDVLTIDFEQKRVPITEVKDTDLVWDGEEYVTHEGVVFSGVKEVITYDGITATPDHRIFTVDGETKTLLEAATRQDRIKVSNSPSVEQINADRGYTREPYARHEATL